MSLQRSASLRVKEKTTKKITQHTPKKPYTIDDDDDDDDQDRQEETGGILVDESATSPDGSSAKRKRKLINYSESVDVDSSSSNSTNNESHDVDRSTGQQQQQQQQQEQKSLDDRRTSGRKRTAVSTYDINKQQVQLKRWSSTKPVQSAVSAKSKRKSANGDDEKYQNYVAEQVSAMNKWHRHWSKCLKCKEKEGADSLQLAHCFTCSNACHFECLDAELVVASVPKTWFCPRCANGRPKVHVKKLLTWRWKQTSDKSNSNTDAHDRHDHGEVVEVPRQREYFVKYDGLSYWHCEWVDEMAVRSSQQSLASHYKAKRDMSEPPSVDSLQDWCSEDYNMDATNTKGYKAHLDDAYYKNGVRPSYMQIQRIVAHKRIRGNTTDCYLVKWCDLDYDQCTWEIKGGRVSTQIDDWDEHCMSYMRHRKRMLAPKDKQPWMVAKQEPAKRYDEQPDYLSSTSGGKLHAYQLEGLNWLRFSWSQGTDVILADEMGLGKTIQTIAFLNSLFKEGHVTGPFLVSVPLSTLNNWAREFETWAPDMYVVTYIGDADARTIIRKYEMSVDEDAFFNYSVASRVRQGKRLNFDVLLTSYQMVAMDKTCLASIKWRMLVVDEAHRLKNDASLFFRTLSDYSIEFRMLLTGTPLQNNLEELYCLMNFLRPEDFNDREHFVNEFSELDKAENIAKLHALLGPHMLRRLKADVFKDMPSKTELIVRVDMAPLQKKMYKMLLTKNFRGLFSKHSRNNKSMSYIIVQLIKCCNHPYLFEAGYEDAPMTSDGFYEGEALIKACGKLEVLRKMLPRLREQGHRVLIFSQMTRTLDLIEDFLRHLGWSFERIDGSVANKDRQDAIDRFNAPGSQCHVFLLSTKAGGLGINLASADTVIIYDSDWNPHNDIQAFSRSHRIGQKNKVMIYRFVTRNSIEERLTQVAKKKMMLTHLVVRSGMGSGSRAAAESREEGGSLLNKLSKEELADIIRFGSVELFKDEAGVDKIVYDDAAIEALLDRNQDVTPEDQQYESASNQLNDYFSSFKVAAYVAKKKDEVAADDKLDEIEDEEAAEPGAVKLAAESDREFWSKLFDTKELIEPEEQLEDLGKGKRVRKAVNYAPQPRVLYPNPTKSTDNNKAHAITSTDIENHKPVIAGTTGGGGGAAAAADDLSMGFEFEPLASLESQESTEVLTVSSSDSQNKNAASDVLVVAHVPPALSNNNDDDDDDYESDFAFANSKKKKTTNTKKLDPRVVPCGVLLERTNISSYNSIKQTVQQQQQQQQQPQPPPAKKSKKTTEQQPQKQQHKQQQQYGENKSEKPSSLSVDMFDFSMD